MSQEQHNLLPDPEMNQVPHHELSLPSDLAQEVKGMDQNFALIADLINVTGTVEVHQQQFTPFVPAIAEVEVQEPSHTPKKRKVVEDRFIPDPYTVTFNNLRSTVVALANPNTNFAVRQYFVENNPIPNAVFVDNVLQNPEVIIPNGYDRTRLKRDLRAAEAFFGLLGSKLTSLMGKCQFNGRGAPSQLCGYYKEMFRLSEGDVYSPAHSRIRSARPIETNYMLRGVLSLLGETPVDGLERGNRQFAFREPVNQVEYTDVDWSGLVTQCLKKR